jgi:hypothetical protein
MDETQGSGRAVLPGDRVLVRFTGTYATGDTWGHGPLTYMLGDATYPTAQLPLQEGGRLRMQVVISPTADGPRLLEFLGVDMENEAYRMRRDRGQAFVEHEVVHSCRPMRLHLLTTGFGSIDFPLGCWRLPRGRPPRTDQRVLEYERLAMNNFDTTAARRPIVPPAVPRASVDTAAILAAPDGLHQAARAGLAVVVGRLLRDGASADTRDAHGFTALHWVGYAQRPPHPFAPVRDSEFVAVIDTLLAHGADVSARVTAGAPLWSSAPADEFEGANALTFAAGACADRIATRLVAAGARADAMPRTEAPALSVAAANGCPETVRLLLGLGASANQDSPFRGTALQSLSGVGTFHSDHVVVAQLLVAAGARVDAARARVQERLKDPGPGGFGFHNRPVARAVLRVLEGKRAERFR